MNRRTFFGMLGAAAATRLAPAAPASSDLVIEVPPPADGIIVEPSEGAPVVIRRWVDHEPCAADYDGIQATVDIEGVHYEFVIGEWFDLRPNKHGFKRAICTMEPVAGGCFRARIDCE